MIPTLLQSTLATLLVAHGVHGHMGLWHPSGYGFNMGDHAVTPLANKPFDQWWFHGYIDQKPSEVMNLVPGQDITLEIACSKAWTSYGDRSTSDACPNDAGSYHAGGTTGVESGWNGNSEDNLMGCALAIAFKSNPYDVKPEDFTVMSVQEQCVRQRDTVFSIPSNLPACPEGGCTCSWFWAGKNSALEMYMAGFRCDVQGGVVTTNYPKPVAPRQNSITGPTQPFYWANDLNNLGFTPEWATKPSYNSAWGWSNGAQEIAFGQSSGGGQVSTSDGSSRPTSSRDDWTQPTSSYDGDEASTTAWAQSTSSRRRRPRPTSSDASPTWQQLVASASPSAKKQCKRKLRSRAHM